MGYGLDRSPFFVVASTGASVWYGVGVRLPPTPQEKRPISINSSCARIKPIFNLWPIFGSKKLLQISPADNVVCQTHAQHLSWL